MSEAHTASIRLSIEVELDRQRAFDTVVEELAGSLATRGMHLEPGPSGRVGQGSIEVGRVTSWRPPDSISMEWRAADWEMEESTQLQLRFEPAEGGTRITLEHRGWNTVLRDGGSELTGWFAGEIAAPVLEAMSPARFGDWFTDRHARRPSGAGSRDVYRDPLYHRPNFRALLETLALAPDDLLLEVGCGGGALLHDALESGCRARAIDHSPDMVRTAREANREAIDEGRLDIVEGDAGNLPFEDDTFTCAVMTGVFQFLPDPEQSLREIHRVLAPGGRLAMFTGSKELRGTPAAPEPMASRLRFYEPEELEQVARDAGFSDVRVDSPDLAQHARDVGVPEEAISLFEGSGGVGQLLTARA